MRKLISRIHYSVPVQNLEIDMTTLPALPDHRFVIADTALREA